MQYILSEEEYKAIGAKAVEEAGNKEHSSLSSLLEPEDVRLEINPAMFGEEKLTVVYDVSKLDPFVVDKFQSMMSRY